MPGTVTRSDFAVDSCGFLIFPFSHSRHMNIFPGRTGQEYRIATIMTPPRFQAALHSTPLRHPPPGLQNAAEQIMTLFLNLYPQSCIPTSFYHFQHLLLLKVACMSSPEIG
jgi:hypothetical protein